MRRMLLPICTFLMLAPGRCGWAHDEAMELGHHWNSPVYIGEMRVQIIIMAALACMVWASLLVGRAWKRRSAGQ